MLGVKEPPKDAVAALRGSEPLLDEVRRIYLNEYAAALGRSSSPTSASCR